MFSQLARFAAKVVAAVGERRRFAAARAELKAMSDLQLADLGIRRDQIDDYIAGMLTRPAVPPAPRRRTPTLRLVSDRSDAPKDTGRVERCFDPLCCPDRRAA